MAWKGRPWAGRSGGESESVRMQRRYAFRNPHRQEEYLLPPKKRPGPLYLPRGASQRVFSGLVWIRIMRLSAEGRALDRLSCHPLEGHACESPVFDPEAEVGRNVHTF